MLLKYPVVEESLKCFNQKHNEKAPGFFIIFYITFSTTINAQGKSLSWDFPINRTHAGILLGNSVQGLMVWGNTTLNITVGRAGFWDHRGGNHFASRTNFKQVKNLLQQKIEDSLRKLFAYIPSAGEPACPQHLKRRRMSTEITKKLPVARRGFESCQRND